MKRPARLYYRWWCALNHQGLVQNTGEGHFKNKLALAVGAVVAAAPILLLPVAESAGLQGWPRDAWATLAFAWALGIIAVMLFQTCKSAVRYYREWWNKRGQS